MCLFSPFYSIWYSLHPETHSGITSANKHTMYIIYRVSIHYIQEFQWSSVFIYLLINTLYPKHTSIMYIQSQGGWVQKSVISIQKQSKIKPGNKAVVLKVLRKNSNSMWGIQAAK